MSQRQGVLPYVVEVAERADKVTARAGLPLVLETMRALGLGEVIERELRVRQRHSGYTESEKVGAVVLLLAAGGECLDDIAVLKADRGLMRLLGGELPAADTLRNFLYRLHDERLVEVAKRAAAAAGREAYIVEESAGLQSLGRVNRALVHRVSAQGTCRRATLDLDATLEESHKREAMAHYQGGPWLSAGGGVLGGGRSDRGRRVPRRQRAGGNGEPAGDRAGVLGPAADGGGVLLSGGQRGV